jgi:hypothetical protein
MPRPGEPWLTESERDFFATMGIDARVNGKTVKRPSNMSRIPAIAARSPQPLRGRIETITGAYDKMKVTAEEKAKFGAFLTNGQAVVQRQMTGAILGTLLGQDPTEAATEATNQTLKQARVADAWKLQREWLERALAAREEADKALADILGDMQQRAGRSRPGTDLALSVEVNGAQLSVMGHVGANYIGQPVLQLTLYRKSTGGQWTGLNLAGAAFGQALGLKELDPVEGTKLALAQERAMNLSLVTTVLLPDLESGGRVNISLGLAASAAGIVRVEARLWSAEGSFKVDAVSGLHEARLPICGGQLLPTIAPIRRNPLGGMPPGSAECFVKGSIWQGIQTQTRPLVKQVKVELFVTDRNGEQFKADLRRDGQHLRDIEGTIKDGSISWQAADSESSKGFPHAGSINGKQLQVTYSGKGATGRTEGAVILRCVSPEPR